MKVRRNTSAITLVDIEEEYKSIYDLKNVCGLIVDITPLRRRNSIVQCHRCQLYGHMQKNCNANFRCMKCEDDHSTHLCNKPATASPRCSNYEGEHLSTFLRCPNNHSNPKHHRKEELTVNVWHNREEEKLK